MKKSARLGVLAGMSLLPVGLGGLAVPPAVADTTITNATSQVNLSNGNYTIAGSGISITGTTDAAILAGNGISVGTLANLSTITSTLYAIGNYGSIGALVNLGLISSTTIGIDNEASLGTLTNAAGATIMALNDRGQAIDNNGTIQSLTNAGSLIVTGAVSSGGGSNPMGIANYKTILSLTNSGLISVSGSSSTGIYNGGTAGGALTNAGTIATLVNSGTITVSGASSAGVNSGSNGSYSIGTLTNRGTISASGSGAFGVFAAGAIGTLTNSGLISASGTGAVALSVRRAGTIQGVVNTGTIAASGGNAIGISILGNTTTIGTLASLTNSGLISGQAYAIYSNGVLGAVENSGVITGNIRSANALTLSGASGSSYGTLTGVSAGAQGTITADSVTFAAGNLLLDDAITGLSGAAQVTNSGATLRIDNTVAITGNYTQGASGLLVVGITSPASYGSLAVSGTAVLSGSTVNLVSTGTGTISSGTYTLVSAGTLSAADVTVRSVLPQSTTVTITGTSLVVGLSSWREATASLGVDGGPVGTVLDHLVDNSAFQSVLLGLSSLSGGQRDKAIVQLGGAQLTPQLNVSGAPTVPTTSAVEGHQTALLEGGGSGRGRAAGSAYRQGAAWGQLLGAYVTRDTTANANGFIASGVGVLFGADMPVDDDLTAGLALSWLNTHASGRDNASGQHTELNSYQLTAYATWRPEGGPLFLQGQLGAAYNQYDQSRMVDFMSRKIYASYGGSHYLAKLTAGHDLALGDGLTLTPLLSAQETHVRTDAYQERGGGVLGLAVRGQSFDSVSSELGARIAARIITDEGPVGADFQAGWVHSYTDGAISTSAALGGQGFVISTDRPSADGLHVVTGTTLEKADGLSLRLEYDGEMRHDYQSHTGMVKVRQEF